MRIRVFLSFASFFAEHLAPQEPASEYLSFRRWVPFLEIHTWEKGIQLPPQRTFFCSHLAHLVYTYQIFWKSLPNLVVSRSEHTATGRPIEAEEGLTHRSRLISLSMWLASQRLPPKVTHTASLLAGPGYVTHVCGHHHNYLTSNHKLPLPMA